MKKLEKVQKDETIDDITKQEIVQTITAKKLKPDQEKSDFYVEAERKLQSGDKPG